jgi:sialate O-acetylesterase
MRTSSIDGILDCMGKLLLALALLHSTSASAQGAGEAGLLNPMFQEHGVLQRDQPIRIWGTAPPGRQVQASLDTHRAKTRANQAGTWEVLLPSLPAGGPHVLTVSDGVRTQSVGDLLVGDVWLCSGQSNMELQVWRSLDAASELGNAIAPTIRFLTVPQSASPVPLDAFPTAAHWQTVNANTLRDFSAACFFFARELQKSVDVPMGLINASWGGSRIQAWIGPDALGTDLRYRESLEVLALYDKDPLAAAQRWGEVWGKWWEQRAGTATGDRPWSLSDDSVASWRKAPRELGPWEHWNEPALADYNGMVWFRSTVKLTPDQARQEAVLELGALDETDITWVNGRAVGSKYDPGSARRYALPQGLLREGENKIVINVLDTYRDGGMSAPASAYRLVFQDGSSAPLSDWDYRAAAEGEPPPSAPWQSAGGVSTLHNGMIAPLGRYGLRGILWYQGESNTGEAGEYHELLRRLSAGWRARFGSGLPILVVQLAGYGMPPTAPGESGWASLREAQRQVAEEDPHTALAIALDIGDRYDIHPANKQEVGRRLARAARQLIYQQGLSASGPVPVFATRQGDAIVVRFGDVSEALVAYGAEGPIGFELCGDAVGSCHYASGQIDGLQVVLRSAFSGKATRVRYGWADNPVINLFDRAGLPAGPFEIAIP